MSPKTTQAEHKRRIGRVLDYIFSHVGEEIGLRTLAGVAHYSPFHLQKLFKQQVGETPKQYGLHLKLETAFHWLIIHPRRSIREIALESGFSSPAVFSRDMKNYFGGSPEQLRGMSHRQQMKILHGERSGAGLRKASDMHAIDGPDNSAYAIQIIRTSPIKGIYEQVPFNDPDAIRAAFHQLGRYARSIGMRDTAISFLGVLTPHQRNTYRALMPLLRDTDSRGDYPVYEITGGVFASFEVCGDLRETNKAAHYFYRRWLPDSGYKIAGIAGFETFAQDPGHQTYTQIRRRIHIPIEPDI